MLKIQKNKLNATQNLRTALSRLSLVSQKKLRSASIKWVSKHGCDPSPLQLDFSYGSHRLHHGPELKMETLELLRDSFGSPSGGLRLQAGYYSQALFSPLLQLSILISFST